MTVLPYGTIISYEASVHVFQGVSQRGGARGNAAPAGADSDPEKYVPSGIFMSFLFDKRTKKVAKVVWSVLAVIIAFGMVIFFAPGVVNIFLS